MFIKLFCNSESSESPSDIFCALLQARKRDCKLVLKRPSNKLLVETAALVLPTYLWNIRIIGWILDY